MKAMNEGKVKIAGDLTLALDLEKVFIKAGGKFFRQFVTDLYS